MYYNNLNRQEDDDLKFMPLNINEQFTNRDSSWFPIIDMALPTFSEIPNSFDLGSSMPVDNFNSQGSSLNTLDYIQSNSVNVQSNMNQNEKMFEENFNLEYPSQTFGDELISYNKDEKCKKNTSMNPPMPNTNTNMNRIYDTSLNEVPMPNNDIIEIKNNDMQSIGNEHDYIEEPIHMELLRNLDFENYLDKSYRGGMENQREVDMIFKIVKDDNSIADTFRAYNVPTPISDLIIKKIIKINLENSNCK